MTLTMPRLTRNMDTTTTDLCTCSCTCLPQLLPHLGQGLAQQVATWPLGLRSNPRLLSPQPNAPDPAHVRSYVRAVRVVVSRTQVALMHMRMRINLLIHIMCA